MVLYIHTMLLLPILHPDYITNKESPAVFPCEYFKDEEEFQPRIAFIPKVSNGSVNVIADDDDDDDNVTMDDKEDFQ